MDLRDIAEEYLEGIRLKKTHGTYTGYVQRLLVFVSYMEMRGIPLERIRPRTVDEFVEWLGQTHSSHTKGQPLSSYTKVGYVRVVKSFLNWCMREGEEMGITVNPLSVKYIELPSHVSKVIEIFTEEQIEAMKLAAAQNYNDHLRQRDRCIVQLLSTTGIRASELCNLTIETVHLPAHESSIKVLGKRNKERIVPMPMATRRMMGMYFRGFRRRAEPGDPFFVNRAGKESLTVYGLEQIIHRLAKYAGITGVRASPHVFRHTFAHAFMVKDGRVVYLSRLLGHESIETTEQYLRAFTSMDVVAALRKMGEWI